jgi:RNase P/RNase MRP subunit p30
MERKDSITFSRMRKAMGVAEEHRLKVILSSGARNNWMIRSPIELSALAASLGLSQQTSMTGVSSTPLSIVAENRKKREAEYVEEGVRIIVPSGGRKA